MKVFVVLCDNYGDQRIDFCGVFATKKLAEIYISKRPKSERQYYIIEEEEVRDSPG